MDWSANALRSNAQPPSQSSWGNLTRGCSPKRSPENGRLQRTAHRMGWVITLEQRGAFAYLFKSSLKLPEKTEERIVLAPLGQYLKRSAWDAPNRWPLAGREERHGPKTI